jgi:hypothetical protein
MLPLRQRVQTIVDANDWTTWPAPISVGLLALRDVQQLTGRCTATIGNGQLLLYIRYVSYGERRRALA